MIDLTGMLAGAAEGGAKAVGDIATGKIENQRRIDLAQQLSAIEEAKQMRVAEAAERMRREGVLWGTQGAGADAQLGFNKRAGEQATDLAVQQERLLGPEKAKNAGLITTAQEEAKGVELAPGQQQWRNGQKVAENTRQTNAEVTGDLYREGLKQPAGGGSKGVAYEAKQWDQYAKPDKDLYSMVDDAGKERSVPVLHDAYRQTYQLLRQQAEQGGGMGASQAAADAAGFVMKLRAKAESRVADSRKTDPKSTLTMDQAVVDIQQELKAAMAARDNPESSVAPVGERPAADKQAPTKERPPGLLVAGRSKPAPDADLEARAAAESREMNDLKRTQFSPEVQAYLDAKRQAAERERRVMSDQERADFFRRSQQKLGLLR